MKRTTIVEGIALLFCVLFLYTGASKLLDFYFFRALLGSHFLPKGMIYWTAIILPLVEVFTAIFLFLPKTRTKALYTTSLLILIFSSYIIYILIFKIRTPVICGGIFQELSWPQLLAFNCLLMILAITAIQLVRKNVRNSKTRNRYILENA